MPSYKFEKGTFKSFWLKSTPLLNYDEISLAEPSSINVGAVAAVLSA